MPRLSGQVRLRAVRPVGSRRPAPQRRRNDRAPRRGEQSGRHRHVSARLPLADDRRLRQLARIDQSRARQRPGGQLAFVRTEQLERRPGAGGRPARVGDIAKGTQRSARRVEATWLSTKPTIRSPGNRASRRSATATTTTRPSSPTCRTATRRSISARISRSPGQFPTSLKLRLYVDDGAIIYLNGQR